MNILQLLIVLILAVAVHSPALAQNCNSKINHPSEEQRFIDNRDGSITDQHTGLQWSQCSLGQIWDNGTCYDEARALPFAIVSLVAEKGWRLPTVLELSSLIDLRCSSPAINQKMFPTVSNGVYWTATRFVNRDGHFWQVHFLHGEAVPEKVDSLAFVRWVRDE